MDITKQITVIDKDRVKIGDRLKFTNKKSNNNTYRVVLVSDVQDDKLVIKAGKDNSINLALSIDELSRYSIEKISSKTSRFKVGDLYRVEDINSCNKFDALIASVLDGEISVIKLRTATSISIKKSEIDIRYRFTKIKANLRHGKDKDEWFDFLAQRI